MDALLDIWIHPRRTVRAILDENPDRLVLLLIGLSGIDQTLTNASNRNLGDTLPLAGILAVAILLGPLGGLFGVWIVSHLIVWTGRWLKGAAPAGHVRAALAWGTVPNVFALIVWAGQIGVFGNEMFTKETPRIDAAPVALAAFYLLLFVQMALGIWSTVLACNTVAEAQGFRSAWLGLANLLLAGLVILVPVVALVLLIVALTHAPL